MRNRKTALITGVNGQDGSLLAFKMVRSGYKVFGTYRPSSNQSLWRLQELGIDQEISLIDLEIGQFNQLPSYLSHTSVSKIFHFAGSSFTVSLDRNPLKNYLTNTSGVIEICEFAKQNNPEAPVFISGSAEVFGRNSMSNSINLSVNANTNVSAYNIYGVSHISNLQISDYYRNNYNLKICNGIMFNHESEYRSEQFFSRKLSIGIARLMLDKTFILCLGNLNVKKDIGSASEFVDIIYRTAEVEVDGKLIIGTGQLTSLYDVVLNSLKYVGFDPIVEASDSDYVIRNSDDGRVLVKSDKQFMRTRELDPWFADTNQMLNLFGISPKSTLIDLMPNMVDRDQSRLKVINYGR